MTSMGLKTMPSKKHGLERIKAGNCGGHAKEAPIKLSMTG